MSIWKIHIEIFLFVLSVYPWHKIPLHIFSHAADIPQDPDVIPNTVRNTPVPPDICISENEKVSNINENYGNRNPRDFDNEYGALVSSIRDQTKEKENLHEDSYNSEDYDAQVHSVTQPLLQGHNNSPSAAMNISLDSLSGGGGQRSYNGRHQESPLASSYSSQSGSDTRNSTPVSGKTSSKIIFSPDSCTDCDHRLKLYLETKLFRGSDDEEFRCMIKVSKHIRAIYLR